ncbi:MAG: YHS domain-containing protein [Verrucomicrobia bacterium]|nr:YHS domain-containing protein [Deltaproteobacteria bacterium]
MRLLIWLLLIYIGYRVIVAMVRGKKPEEVNHGNAIDAAVTHRDPVCGMYVSEEDAVIGKLDGQRHYFCSMSCLEKYREQLDHSQNP